MRRENPKSTAAHTALLILAAAIAAWPADAAEMTWAFAAPQSQVHWTLDSTLHEVHGTFKLKSGTITFDPATGKAGGALVIDATSGESGNESRDRRMHSSIIESQKYTEIVFRPERVEGALPAQGSATLQVHGKFKLMNSEHDITIPVTVESRPGQIIADAKFTVPYIKWGVKNPSVMFLRVADHVDVQLHSVGHAATAVSASK